MARRSKRAAPYRAFRLRAAACRARTDLSDRGRSGEPERIAQYHDLPRVFRIENLEALNFAESEIQIHFPRVKHEVINAVQHDCEGADGRVLRNPEYRLPGRFADFDLGAFATKPQSHG